MKISGYVGKYAMVDLTTRKYDIHDFDEEDLRYFMGGATLGAKILFDRMPAKTPWDAPESIIGFVCGVANGTGALISPRYTVVSKSPVTNMWNDANSGGHFGPQLRRSGYDAVFVKGISEKPVYILIDNGKIIFHDASKLWGMTVQQTEDAIREELSDNKVGIATIGPAGERLSYMSAIMNDTHRAAARGGPGAVMGKKNFKAIVCRGNTRFDVHDKEGLLAINNAIMDWSKTGPLADTIYPLFANHGTGGLYEGSVYQSDASIKNWGGIPSELTDDAIKSITTTETDKRWKVKKYTCNACSVGCGAIYEIKDGSYPIKETGRPEYESGAAFGSNLLCGSPELVNWCNYLCNDYGFDTISFGGAIAWAMECFSKGLFTIGETGGVDLSWGNTEGVAQLAEAMCKGTSEFALVLNNGSLAAAKHYGRGLEYVMHMGGIEAPHHDPRLNPGVTRTFQYDPTPGRHVKGGQGFGPPTSLLPIEVKYDFDDPEQGVRDVAGVIDAEVKGIGGFCEVTGFAFPPGTKQRILTAVTGLEFDGEEYDKLGKRSYTIRHMFNIREGMKREDNTIAGRLIGKPAMTEGPHTGRVVENEKLADMFFKEMGWDPKTMIPPKAVLEELGGMDAVIADLYGG